MDRMTSSLIPAEITRGELIMHRPGINKAFIAMLINGSNEFIKTKQDFKIYWSMLIICWNTI